MRNKFIYVGCFILIFIAFIIGFLIAKVVTIPGITFTKEIDPLNGVSIFLTAFVAILISLLFEIHKENSKIQRELILKRTDELCEYIHQFCIELNNEMEITEVTRALKKVGMLMISACELLELIGVKEIQFRQNFLLEYRKLRTLMTFTPENNQGGAEPPIKATNNKYVYTISRRIEIENTLDELKNCILKLQIRIANN